MGLNSIIPSNILESIDSIMELAEQEEKAIRENWDRKIRLMNTVNPCDEFTSFDEAVFRFQCEIELRKHREDVKNRIEQIKNISSDNTQVSGNDLVKVNEDENGNRDVPVWAHIKKSYDGYDDVLLPLELQNERNSFYLEGENIADILEFSYHLIRVFITSIPVGDLRICVYDAETLGTRIKPFLEFKNKTVDVFDKDIYTTPDELIKILEDLDIQIRDFTLNKLSSYYDDIFAYNRAQQGSSEKITLLLLYDFPGFVDRKCADILLRILKNGNKCGIYVVMCHSSNMMQTNGTIDETITDAIKEYCLNIECNKGSYTILREGTEILIPDIPDQNRIAEFTDKYVKEKDKLLNRSISFAMICNPDRNRWFKNTTEDGLEIPIGIGDDGETVCLSVGKQAYHGLIIGGTGSGKSTLLHTIIMNSMICYSPEELELYLMDFKSGMEFQIYEKYKLPHIRVLALDAIQEFGESILEKLLAEMDERANKFKGMGVRNLKEYKSSCSDPMTRVLVLIDEFQVLYDIDQNRKVADHCAQMTSRLVKQGRAYGIHLLMSTQNMRFGNLAIDNSVFGDMRIRIGLNWADQDTMSLFGADNERLRRLKDGPVGKAVMTGAMGNQEEKGFRVAICDDSRQYLESIEEYCARYDSECLVFDGQREYSLLDNIRSEKPGADDEIKVYIGEKIKIAPPLVLKLVDGDNRNLLVCGSDRDMERRISENYMISVSRYSNVGIACIDGEYISRRSNDSTEQFYKLLGNTSCRFKLADNNNECISMINDAYGLYLERKNRREHDISAMIVFIRNIHACDLVKSILRGETPDVDEGMDVPEDDSLEKQIAAMMSGSQEEIISVGHSSHVDEISYTDKLYRLMKDGNNWGIHLVVSSRTVDAVRECNMYSNKLLDHFKQRIVFSVSDNDAVSLLEGVKISGLMPGTVYYTDGLTETMQIKPYRNPEPDELKAWISRTKE